jgi:hypothetical protein
VEKEKKKGECPFIGATLTDGFVLLLNWLPSPTSGSLSPGLHSHLKHTLLLSSHYSVNFASAKNAQNAGNNLGNKATFALTASSLKTSS